MVTAHLESIKHLLVEGEPGAQSPALFSSSEPQARAAAVEVPSGGSGEAGGGGEISSLTEAVDQGQGLPEPAPSCCGFQVPRFLGEWGEGPGGA